MKVAVIGSRDFNDYKTLKENIGKIKNISLIISGGAKGADSLAEQYALENSIETLVIKPDWKRFNQGAGLIRNKQIVDSSDIVIAFWDAKSKGTAHAIEYAKKQNKEIIIVLSNQI
jgi:predicted Rossmann fold nucleotide-binding protein DprA/Smf involved in DNA uptake